MGALLIAGVVLLVTHLGASRFGLREVLVSRVGEGPYLGLYSLVTLAVFGWFIWLYATEPRLEYFWFPDPRLYWVPKVLMVLAGMLLVGGFMVKNPTAVGQGSVLGDPETLQAAATGVNRITRHPFQWAVMLWASSHLIANGDHESVVFFAVFFLLSALGTLNLDAKKRAELGDDFAAFEKLTSNLPFAAILTGRNKLVMSELFLPLLAGVAVYALMYFGHDWLSGVALV